MEKQRKMEKKKEKKTQGPISTKAPERMVRKTGPMTNDSKYFAVSIGLLFFQKCLVKIECIETEG